MKKIDDRSGYDHILLTKESPEYLGIEWGGLWWVCATLPFWLKNSRYVYQTIGLVATNDKKGLLAPSILTTYSTVNLQRGASGRVRLGSGIKSTAISLQKPLYT